MNTLEMLDSLQHKAFLNEEVRLRLLSVKEDKNPLEVFCKVAQDMGYALYPMEVICAGEEFHASMK